MGWRTPPRTVCFVGFLFEEEGRSLAAARPKAGGNWGRAAILGFDRSRIWLSTIRTGVRPFLLLKQWLSMGLGALQGKARSGLVT